MLTDLVVLKAGSAGAKIFSASTTAIREERLLLTSTIPSPS